jgi:hypothetical protein
MMQVQPFPSGAKPVNSRTGEVGQRGQHADRISMILEARADFIGNLVRD